MKRLWTPVFASAAVWGLMLSDLALEARAQTAAVQSGNWSDPATWSPAEPAAGGLATINGGFTVGIDQAGEVAGIVNLGDGAGQTGSLTVAAPGDLTVDTAMRVGFVGGVGNATISGGTVTINGAFNSGIGNGELLVGDAGGAAGTLTMSGGSLSAADEIFIGLGAGSNGDVNVSGGAFFTRGRSIIVGFDGGTGSLDVSGTGDVDANFDLLVGLGVNANGTVTLSAGSIDAGFVFTNAFTGGAGSTSTINQTGGTITARIAYVLGQGNGTTTNNHSGGAINVDQDATPDSGEFVVGDGGGNTSTYNISGTADVNVRTNFVVGRDGTGVVNMSGGTIDATNVFLGDFDSSSGTLDISGGTFTLNGNLSVGGALASNAAVFPPGNALDANGTLIVSGTGGVIDVGGNLLANPDDNPRIGGAGERNDATLIFEALAGGVSIVDIAGIADLTGAEIDLDLLNSFAVGTSFDLITATDISTDYVQASEDVGAISLAVVAGGNGQILRATVIPEPAALGLVATAALALVPRRRKSVC